MDAALATLTAGAHAFDYGRQQRKLDAATEELRELARLRERLAEDFASRLRQLHQAVDLGFPEFMRHVRTLESQLTATILSRYPTAACFRGASVKKLARIVYDG
jgi:transposase